MEEETNRDSEMDDFFIDETKGFKIHFGGSFFIWYEVDGIWKSACVTKYTHKNEQLMRYIFKIKAFWWKLFNKKS